jgi:hypothetical protein
MEKASNANLFVQKRTVGPNARACYRQKRENGRVKKAKGESKAETAFNAAQAS